MTMANDRDLKLQTDDGLGDEAEDLAIEPDSGNLPQEITESYGTGVHDQPNDLGGRSLRDRVSEYNEASVVLTGGDLDASFEEADAVGEEAVGGTTPTPDMSVVDELGAAVGLEMDDQAFLRTSELLEERDDRRWELEPKSSEDFDDRRTEEELD
jgi:Family of unknown function (DUF6335)